MIFYLGGISLDRVENVDKNQEDGDQKSHPTWYHLPNTNESKEENLI